MILQVAKRIVNIRFYLADAPHRRNAQHFGDCP